MGLYIQYIVFLIFLIIGSIFFSGSEAAFFSFKKIKLKNLPDDSPLKVLGQLMERPGDVIITLLIGNEIVNITFAVIMAKLISSTFVNFPLWINTALSTGLSVSILLFLGEVTPKTVAVKYYHHFSIKAIKPFYIFFKLVKPLRIVITKLTSLIDKSKRDDEEYVDEKSFINLADELAESGGMDVEHAEMIKSVFMFDDITVSSIMTEADSCYSLDYNLSLKEIIDEVAESVFTRVPIYRGQKENLIGILNKKELLRFKENLPDEDFSLTDILYQPIFVDENETINRVFAIMKRNKKHVALVKNRNEKLVGLVTLEDIIEELTGEIIDEKERLFN